MLQEERQVFFIQLASLRCWLWPTFSIQQKLSILILQQWKRDAGNFFFLCFLWKFLGRRFPPMCEFDLLSEHDRCGNDDNKTYPVHLPQRTAHVHLPSVKVKGPITNANLKVIVSQYAKSPYFYCNQSTIFDSHRQLVGGRRKVFSLENVLTSQCFSFGVCFLT